MGIDAPTGAFDANFGGERYLSTPALQKSADVQAMQTIYEFVCGPVGLTLTFTAPLFLDDLELISRPVNYISYETRSLDGAAHDVQIYFEASPACAVNTADQQSVGSGYRKNGLLFVRTGSKEQNVLQRKGDQIKIDWGYFYLSTGETGSSQSVGSAMAMRKAFATAANSTAESPPPAMPISPSPATWAARSRPKAWSWPDSTTSTRSSISRPTCAPTGTARATIRSNSSLHWQPGTMRP